MMNLKVKIHNKVFENKLVQGCTFTEEYTETLDSGNIILSQVKKIKNLQPYDDVYIYDGDFKGFDEKGNIIGNCTFYKHLLVDSFTEERLNLQSNIYKYKIQLFSETKGLETVQLPNISVTQPLNVNKKISIYNYMNQFINMYSPRIKVAIDVENQKWEYKPKYKLSEQWVDLLDEGEGVNRKTMKDIFAHSYTPDFTLNNPNLKDVLAKLMIVKDRIPVVYNNVIYAMDITKRRKKFDFDKGQINFISASNSSSNYADNLKRTYLDALSQDRTCKMVEYLGFRNKDTALMKLSDLRIETSFPIYKINKIYMCYYKKVTVKNRLDITAKDKYQAFLCKQDITPLVKLNSERNLLIQDWDDFEENIETGFDVGELSKYKMATIGYDIGSNRISGWGEKYGYTKGWWKTERTYIENIFSLLDSLYPFGIYKKKYIIDKAGLATGETIDVPEFKVNFDEALANIVSPYSNNTLKLKGFFFEVEYDAFYNGTVIHTKDLAIGDTMMLDNPSSSLSLLEMDGLAQKEKINRFGNKNYTIPARYTDFKEIQGLGDYYDDDENEADIIIYRKEYSINGNVINCTYQGMKDYVLKNYFTEVYAKHRPYSLMSYGESITRAENRKVMFFLSKNKKYYEQKNKIFNFNDFENEQYIENFFSFFKKTSSPKNFNDFNKEEQINYGYIEINSPIYDENGNIIEYSKSKYASDLNAFVNGNSMCFNMKMTDNVSMGVYVKKAMPFENDENFDPFKDFKDPKDDYTGTLQTWYMATDDIETGFAKDIGFYIGHNDQEETFLPQSIKFSEEDSVYFGKIFGNYEKEHPKIDLSNIEIEDVEGVNYSKLIGGYITIKLNYKDEMIIKTYTNNTSYVILDSNENLIESIENQSSFSFICENEGETLLKIMPIIPTDENRLENRFYSIKIKNEFHYTIDEIYDKKLFLLPKIKEEDFKLSNIIGNNFEINKDNKEIIDMTYQFEPITDDDNIMFSPWMMKLSDLIGNYNKFYNRQNVEDLDYMANAINLYSSTSQVEYDDTTSTEVYKGILPMLTISLKKEIIPKIKKGHYFESFPIVFDHTMYDFTPGSGYNMYRYDIYYSFEPKSIEEIKYVDDSGNLFDEYEEGLTLYYIILKGNQEVRRKKAWSTKTNNFKEENILLKLENLVISSKYYGDAPYGNKANPKLNWNKIPDNEVYLSNVRFYNIFDIFGNISVGGSELIEPIKFDNGKKDFGINEPCVGNNVSYFDPWLEEQKSTSLEYFYDSNSEEYIVSTPGANEETGMPFIYKRNLYVIFDTNELKKNLVYEEYKCLDPNKELLTKLEEGKRKDFLTSIVKYNGAEQEEENVNSSYDKINYEIFRVDYDDNDKSPYILIDLDNKLFTDDIKSVQLWYLDNVENGKEIDVSKASYKFVFGVNLTEKEIKDKEVKIYISELSTLNKKVYDENYNLIGHVTDFGNDKNISETFTINSIRKDNTLYLNMPYDERMFSTYISKYNIEAYVETIYQGEYIMANFDYYPHFIKDEYGEWLVLKSNGDYEFLPHIYLKRNGDHFECQLELQYPDENYEYTYIDFSFVNSEIYIGKKTYGNQHYTTFEEDEAE